MTEAALFLPDGDAFTPTAAAVGPWDPGALHGGPPAALLAGALERFQTEPHAFHVARLTVELLRPVPLAPLTVSVAMRRPGRKVQLVEGSLHADGREVLRATALRIRDADVPISSTVVEPPPPPLPAADSVPVPWPWDGFFNIGVSMRFAAGEFGVPGPATVWIRLNQPVVPDEAVTPLQRVAAAADFGNGVSATVPFGTAVFINPDLTVHLHRPAAGEWVCLDATTQLTGRGAGLAESALYDERGRIGRSLQSLFVDRA